MRSGGAPARPNASHTVAPSTYSPVDQVVSSAVRSDERIFGGRTQSSTTARSPTLACQGSSPTTAATSAVAVEKCAYVSPRYVACRLRVVGTPGAAFVSVQWP